MQLTKDLLFSEEEFENNSMLNGTNVKGSYSTMQFVLRLRDDIKTALNKGGVEFEAIQATSTSIHENIHWWQHVGSNFGFIYSLSYPAFAHLTKENLEKLISIGIRYKSLIKFDKYYFNREGKNDIPDLNIILNNYHDIEYAKLFALDNKNIYKILNDRRFFLHMGHCYHILWSSTVHTIAATLDRDYKFLPKTNNWVFKFRKLTEKKTQGFFIDSPMGISPIGIKAIYEGQAIFNQMQYLAITLNSDLTLADCENVGMLYGIYSEGFDYFLQITKFTKPVDVLDHVIGLFLFVCDLSINPNNGFPLEIYDYENFITKNDPGLRFSMLANEISKKPDYYLDKVKKYSKESYVTLSKELSESIGCKCPYENIPNFLGWSKEPEVQTILDEEKSLKYSNENLPIRVMFSKYYRFQEDKYKYPNVFCWFGLHGRSGGPELDFEVIDGLYKKHHALFTDDFDGEIKPVIFEGREEANIMESFNTFYNFNILYDLTMKWVYEEGKFNLDYKWIANKRAESFIPFVKDGFKKLFGISLSDIAIL